MILAISLYSDWREKYIFENIDKDLRAIQILTSELKFIINQVPITNSDIDKKDKREFYEKYWMLKVHSSYIKEFSDPETTKLVDNYIELLKNTMGDDFDKICNQLEDIENTCDDLHKKISDERQRIFLENG
ncbi:hypothetical protein [Acinetobacter pollinis]|uniref:Uncharacterized protein n=1 Tax=Acinetobacter pollinis TaxID=2605270 RepID=A0ABU6DT32_9GAMM|nr:hypothetical protein [Acinetobacter pollinis]MEB5476058.1 hypothetical protein [Acinetobacter pollinis]